MDLSENFNELFTVASLVSLLTLSVLEIVLGIDNIIFISIVSGKLPKKQQPRARTIGLMLALIMRVILLFSISIIANMKQPLFELGGFGVTGRDLILFAGGVFLLYKTTMEIHYKIEGKEEDEYSVNKVTMKAIIFQIVLIDIVFSFDSILTAVGLVSNVLIMIMAVIIAMIIMIMFSGRVSDFINRNPTIKMLALAFLLMIGMILVLDAFHQHVDKKFIYVSMAFSLLVESLNIRMRKKARARRKQHDHLPEEED
jgi:predicted tellurium resistance membrane protein TerC